MSRLIWAVWYFLWCIKTIYQAGVHQDTWMLSRHPPSNINISSRTSFDITGSTRVNWINSYLHRSNTHLVRYRRQETYLDAQLTDWKSILKLCLSGTIRLNVEIWHLHMKHLNNIRKLPHFCLSIMINLTGDNSRQSQKQLWQKFHVLTPLAVILQNDLGQILSFKLFLKIFIWDH